MSEVMELIEREREKTGLSAEKFANQAGLTVTTYSRQRNGKQALGIDSLQLYAKWARANGNIDLLRILGAYALGLEPDQITINAAN